MNEVHDFLAALCHLRDDLLFPDPSGYDPLSFYSVNLELMSDGEPGRWEAEFVANYLSSGGEENSQAMEKRVRLRIDRGAGITMVVEKGDLPEVRHYPLEARGRDGCLEWLHDHLKRDG